MHGNVGTERHRREWTSQGRIAFTSVSIMTRSIKVDASFAMLHFIVGNVKSVSVTTTPFFKVAIKIAILSQRCDDAFSVKK